MANNRADGAIILIMSIMARRVSGLLSLNAMLVICGANMKVMVATIPIVMPATVRSVLASS